MSRDDSECPTMLPVGRDPPEPASRDHAAGRRRGRLSSTARIFELEAENAVLRGRLAEARTEAERHALLMAEMNHRVRNTFAVVQAMVYSTRRHAATAADFQAAFDSRLMVMARSHDMLMRSDWRDASLRDVIEGALEPFEAGPGRFTLAGDPVLLASNHVVAMSLTFHELATNAVKHGSLSSSGGRVDVEWTADERAVGGPRVEVVWLERGGPRVEPPTRRGFGSQLLAIGMPADGKVRLTFQPEGLECRISMPCTAHLRER